MIDFFSFVYHVLIEFLSIGYLKVWFFPLIALAFLCTVPVIVRKLLRW